MERLVEHGFQGLGALHGRDLDAEPGAVREAGAGPLQVVGITTGQAERSELVGTLHGAASLSGRGCAPTVAAVT
jgi:hypothetical protein